MEVPNVKVSHIIGHRGRPVLNQFIIEHTESISGNRYETFQSYSTIIAQKEWYSEDGVRRLAIYLDRDAWNYSTTTGKYRNIFLGENIDETRRKIKSGEYQLVDLNSSVEVCHKYHRVDDPACEKLHCMYGQHGGPCEFHN